ncbi:MAG: hypothetical protein HRU09_18015, partial [Oligoflexales bacterium]|nr:hypothetical protein [Oligoflexales bacterium]
ECAITGQNCTKINHQWVGHLFGVTLEKAFIAERYMQGIVEQIYVNRMHVSVRPLTKRAIVEALQIANLEGVLCPHANDLGMSGDYRHYLSVQDIVSFASESDAFFDLTDRYRKYYTKDIPEPHDLVTGQKGSAADHTVSAIVGLMGGIFAGPIVVVGVMAAAA